MEEKNGKKVLLSILGVAILVVAVVGISFAAFTFVGPGDESNTVNTGTITMVYNEGNNAISIINAMPMTDAEGMAQNSTTSTCSIDPATHNNEADCIDAGGAWTGTNVFTFTLSATIAGTTNIDYEVSARPAAGNTIAPENIRLYLEKSNASEGTYTPTILGNVVNMSTNLVVDNPTAVGTPIGSKVIDSGQFTATISNYYKLRMWIASGTVIGGTAQTYVVYVDVNAKNAY